MSGVILSVQNDFVRMARTLKDKKGRTQQGAFLVEGVKCVGELLAHQPSLLRTLVVTEDAGEEWVERVRALGRHAVTVAPHVMAAICDTKTPQGLFCLVHMPKASLADMNAATGVLLCENVGDPANVGAMIRSAAGLGLGGVVLSPGCADAFSPKALRASMGAVGRIPVVSSPVDAAVAHLRAAGAVVLATTLEGAVPYTEAPQGRPFVLMVGNEAAGLSPEAVALADERIAIPMHRGVESLNAAAAATALMFWLTQPAGC